MQCVVEGGGRVGVSALTPSRGASGLRCVKPLPHISLAVPLQTPAAAGWGVRGVHAAGGGLPREQEEGHMGDHPGWEGPLSSV